MANAIARAYNGGLEQSRQRGPGAEPLCQKDRGQSPSEAEALLVFEHSIEAGNCPLF